MTTPSKADVLRVAGEPVAYLKTSTISGQRELSFSEECRSQKLQNLYTEAQLLAVYAAGAEAMREQALNIPNYRDVQDNGIYAYMMAIRSKGEKQ